MLSRKYYQKIAEILGRTESKIETNIEIIDMLKNDNPRFDEFRFAEAVGNARAKNLKKVV